MKDYDNIPVQEWNGETGIKHAMAQVQHAEPVILALPEDFNMGIDATACGCKEGPTTRLHLDCHARDVLAALAEENTLPALARLGEIAHTAGQVVDVDREQRRLIIHD